jgi:hypothetical protein
MKINKKMGKEVRERERERSPRTVFFTREGI